MIQHDEYVTHILKTVSYQENKVFYDHAAKMHKIENKNPSKNPFIESEC